MLHVVKAHGRYGIVDAHPQANGGRILGFDHSTESDPLPDGVTQLFSDYNDPKNVVELPAAACKSD